MSRVEVKFNDINVSADVLVGSRGMPTVANAFINKPMVGGSCVSKIEAIPGWECLLCYRGKLL